MSNEAAKTTSNNPFDIFIVGLKKLSLIHI